MAFWTNGEILEELKLSKTVQLFVSVSLKGLEGNLKSSLFKVASEIRTNSKNRNCPSKVTVGFWCQAIHKNSYGDLTPFWIRNDGIFSRFQDSTMAFRVAAAQCKNIYQEWLNWPGRLEGISEGHQ